jgi:hypothetical protein
MSALLREFSQGSSTNSGQNGSTYQGLGERMSHRMAPTCDWTDMGSDEHFVQFFELDEFIVNEVAEYMIHGLKSGDSCIVVATCDHAREIQKIVGLCASDLKRAIDDGKLVILDAEETLEKLLTDGVPDPDKFNDVIGTLVGEAALRDGRIRIFGEMVGVLCSRGQYDDAVKLEGLWNDLRRVHPFSLFCAYSLAHLDHLDTDDCMGSICSGHTRIIPTESYSSIRGTNERLKHIATLQQRTRQLQAEVAELERRISARSTGLETSSLQPAAA